MADGNTPCTQGGKWHKVDKQVLEEARANAAEDGSYTFTCQACGESITKGPTDLTGTTQGTIA